MKRSIIKPIICRGYNLIFIYLIKLINKYGCIALFISYHMFIYPHFSNSIIASILLLLMSILFFL